MKNFFFLLLCVTVGHEVKCDNEARIFFRPCGDNNDMDCIKKFFNEHGRCDVVKTPDKNPRYEEFLTFYVPRVNLTIMAVDIFFSGMDGTMEQFYIDDNTGSLVMSINYNRLMCHGFGYFAIGVKGKEPKILTDNFNATYSVIITAVLPVSDVITADSLHNAQYSAYFPKNNAQFLIGPTFTGNEDPYVSQVYAGFLDNFSTAIQEIFFTKAYYYFLAYLQNYICDYDTKPVVRYDQTLATYVNDMDIDDRTYVMEPCNNVDDVTECVRNFFDDVASCSVVRENPTEPLHMDTMSAYVPSQNMSVSFEDIYLWGLNGQISTFYINKDTGDLIMAANFGKIEVYSSLATFQISQRGRPPKIYSDYIQFSLGVTLTAVMPFFEGSFTSDSLEKSMISAFLPTADFSFKVGSDLTQSRDPQIQIVLQNMINDPMTIAQEMFMNGARNYFLIYLQQYICDFGVAQQFKM